MVRATREGIAAANPDKRPFVLTRSNFLGGQRYAATWTGDNGSKWEHLRMAPPMTLNLGLSGQPFNGPDLGGFGEEATPDLWANWVAVGVFFPFVRAHAQKDLPPKEPWAFGPEVEAVARTAIERRYRLLPYYYTLFHQSSIDGLPMMRPVFFTAPADPRLRAEDRAFLVGSDLLVIPKWAENPQLPAGTWRTLTLDAAEPGSVHPTLKLRGGAILPLGRVVQSTAEDSLAPLTLVIALDADGRASGQLYEDEGDGFGYQHGDYLLTTYEAARVGDDVVVRAAHTEGKRPRPARAVVVQVLSERGVDTGNGMDGQLVRIRLHP
jgi:alpha-glucosidase